MRAKARWLIPRPPHPSARARGAGSAPAGKGSVALPLSPSCVHRPASTGRPHPGTAAAGSTIGPTIVRPVPPHRPLPKTPHFPALEQEVLERWRERDIFRESMRRREGAEPWVFYEGPPTANGRPGSHHVMARVFKDIFPRYQTMRGRFVERKGGWDCHGLPVEIAVEQKL